MVGKNKKRIMITLSQEVYEKLKQLAEDDGRPIANLASYIITQHFKQDNTENSKNN